MRLSFIGLTIILVVVIALQQYYFGYDNTIIQAFNINIISNIIILFATVFVLEKVIRNHYELKKTEEEKDRYKNTLNSRHDKLIMNLESLVIQFVTAKPATIEPRPSIDEIIKIGEDVDRYIDLNLLKRKYEINKVNPDFTVDIKHWNHVDFTFYFKTSFLSYMHNYITRYLPLIPSDLLEFLFKLEDLISSSNAFITPKEHGINVDLKNAIFEDASFVINDVREVIDIIVILRRY